MNFRTRMVWILSLCCQRNHTQRLTRHKVQHQQTDHKVQQTISSIPTFSRHGANHQKHTTAVGNKWVVVGLRFLHRVLLLLLRLLAALQVVHLRRMGV